MRYTNLFVNSLCFNTILIKYAKHTFHFYGGFLLSSACCFPLSFSLPPRYHFVTTPLPSNTFPVLSCYFLYFSLFLLRKSKKCSNFATANPKFADILKSVYYGDPTILSSGVSSALVLALRNLVNFNLSKTRRQ